MLYQQHFPVDLINEVRLPFPAKHDDSNATLLLRTDHPTRPHRPDRVLRPLHQGTIWRGEITEGGDVRRLRSLLSLLLLCLDNQLSHRRHQSILKF